MSRSLLTPDGYSREEWDDGRVVMMNLYTCCHCQKTWEAPTGSLGGAMAGGFCGRCVGYLCTNPACIKECIPYEHRLENIEAGRHELTTRRLLVPVPNMSGIKGSASLPARKIIDPGSLPDIGDLLTSMQQ